MPGDASVWITAIVAIAAVVALALWLGRGLVFKKSSDKVSLEIKSNSADAASERKKKVSVATGVKVGEDGSVGNVTGVSGGSGNADVEVLTDGEILGDVGDVTGVSSPRKTESD